VKPESIKRALLAEAIVMFPDLSLAENEAIAESAYGNLIRQPGARERLEPINSLVDCANIIHEIQDAVRAGARWRARNGWDKIVGGGGE